MSCEPFSCTVCARFTLYYPGMFLSTRKEGFTSSRGDDPKLLIPLTALLQPSYSIKEVQLLLVFLYNLLTVPSKSFLRTKMIKQNKLLNSLALTVWILALCCSSHNIIRVLKPSEGFSYTWDTPHLLTNDQ